MPAQGRGKPDNKEEWVDKKDLKIDGEPPSNAEIEEEIKERKTSQKGGVSSGRVDQNHFRKGT